MKRLLLVLALVALLGIPANAAILNQFVTYDGPIHVGGFPSVGGGEDELIDESRAEWCDGGVQGAFDADDVFFGWIATSDINASGVPSKDIGAFQQLAIAYAGMLTGQGSGAGGTFVAGDVASVVPVPAANACSLQSLLHADITNVAGLTAKSVAVVIGTEKGTSEGGTSPQNFDQLTAAAEMAEFNSNNTFGDTWAWEATLGQVSSADFWEIAIDVFAPPAFDARERAGFTMQSHAYGPTAWLPVDVANLSAGVVTTHDAVLASANVFSPSNDAPWDFKDNSTMVVNPIPEPGSLLIWFVMIGIGLALSLRTRTAKS